MVRISASLLAANMACLGAEVQRAEEAGVQSIHFDIMDGHYAANLAFSPDDVAALRSYTQLPFHLHMEVENPDKMLDAFRRSQAHLIIVCWDTLVDPKRTFRSIRALSAEVGLSLNPGQPPSALGDLLAELNRLMILGVMPGFGGQAMRPDTVDRIAQARAEMLKQGLDIPISVDGGVSVENAANLVQAGASELIVGTGIFGADSMGEYVMALRAAAGW
jgi:ribulose-phosphate 3-epimerase